MRNEDIKDTLKQISALPEKDRFPELLKIARKIRCFYLTDSGTDSHTLFLNIHTYLQSELMLNACVSAETSSDLAKQACNLAKWSCICAAVAAIVAFVSLLVQCSI